MGKELFWQFCMIYRGKWRKIPWRVLPEIYSKAAGIMDIANNFSAIADMAQKPEDRLKRQDCALLQSQSCQS